MIECHVSSIMSRVLDMLLTTDHRTVREDDNIHGSVIV